MKNIEPRLIDLFKEGYCTPQISQIAKKLKEPSTTIHYNIKRMEQEGKIKTYKAVFDYKKINEGHCVYVLINLLPEKYGNPEGIAQSLAEDERIESIDICTGDYELLVKLRVKDTDEYYEWVKKAIQHYGFSKTTSITSLKQIKSEFVTLSA
jgi:DNA-binding Lrp family transcriptional regulator